MDEIKKRRNSISPFSLVLPSSLFCAGKYQKHFNQRKKSINKVNKDQLIVSRQTTKKPSDNL